MALSATIKYVECNFCQWGLCVDGVCLALVEREERLVLSRLIVRVSAFSRFHALHCFRATKNVSANFDCSFGGRYFLVGLF